MSLLQEYHEAHKARVARLGGLPVRVIPVRSGVAAPVQETPVEVPEPVPEPIEQRSPIWLSYPGRIEGIQPIRAPYRGMEAAAIKRRVAKTYGFTSGDLSSGVRCQPLVSVRHIAVYLVHRHTQRTPGQIAWLFGGRDHTTTLNSLRKVAALRASDPAVAAELDYLETVILT